MGSVTLIVKDGLSMPVSLLIEHDDKLVELTYLSEKGLFTLTDHSKKDEQEPESKDVLSIDFFEMDEEHAPRYLGMFLLSQNESLPKMVNRCEKMLNFMRHCQIVVDTKGTDYLKKEIGMDEISDRMTISDEMLGIENDEEDNEDTEPSSAVMSSHTH